MRSVAKSVSRYKPGGSGDRSQNDVRRVVTQPVSEVRGENVRWLQKERVPLGAVTVLAGQQGLGKSTLTLDWAAQLTRGNLDGDLKGEPSSVLVITLEDHIASVVKPRLQAVSADLERVHILGVKNEDGTEGLVTFPEDLPLIEEAVKRTGAKLLIVDPVVATLSGSVDSHKDQSVRRVLAPLAQLAERFDIAVIAVMHLNKSQTGDLVSRVGGSVGWTAAARSVIAFARHPEDPGGDQGDERVLVHAKSNWGPYTPTLAYRIEQRQGIDGEETFSASTLVLTGTADITPADLTDNHGDQPIEEALNFLRVELSDGPKAATDLLSGSRAAGISEKTLRRAKTRLGVQSVKPGKTWDWALPEEDGHGIGHLPADGGGHLPERPANEHIPTLPQQEHGHTHKLAIFPLDGAERPPVDGVDVSAFCLNRDREAISQ